MKSVTLFACSVILATALSQTHASGQATPQAPRRPTPVAGKPVASPQPTARQTERKPPPPASQIKAVPLPDLVVESVMPGQSGPGMLGFGPEKGKTSFVVRVRNAAGPGDASANVTVPFQVWLRVWKPAKAQSLTDPNPGATSHVWGGVKKLEGLKAGEVAAVTFVVPDPPGGWEWGLDFAEANQSKLVYRPKDSQDPLRVRIVARVDSGNAVKESVESNNDGGWFLNFTVGTPPK